MPLVTVRIVCAAHTAVPASTAQDLADRIGAALEAAPGRVWIRLERLDRGDYAENHQSLADADLPVFVSILEHEHPGAAVRRAQAKTLCTAVASATGRGPERVHVLFEPPGAGRVAFGGMLSD